MQRRTLLLLGGAAAAALGGALLLTPRPAERRDMAAGGLAFPGLAERLQRATRIEIRKSDATLLLARQGEVWVLPEKGGYPVRPEKLREMLVGLTELRLAEPRTSDPEQYGRLGVDDPGRPGSTALLLRILDDAGSPLAELLLGRRRVRTQGNVPESIYVRRPGEDQAWLAEGRLAADADPQLWLDRDIANLPEERVRRVAIRRDGEPALVLARGEGPEAKLQVEQPAGMPADEAALDEIARAFEMLTFLDVKPAAEAPGEPVAESRFTLSDGLGVTVLPHLEEGNVWIRLRAEGSEEGARLAARWAPWVYQVGVWKLKAFAPRLDDLKPREAAPEAPPAGAPAR
ncbi:DUF4340 domain-containing protein [Roseicella frigidaeris]|uniref:DUF4340 domain-containing protein n=1 Tax=Roseicella frigidaeris TaxID=2230885 RepID=A0A327MJS3_9PROT|nr:DUF4340 domain-containing protein [Roseicella frigidaeris]RAI60418.1 hypothetical protein DOO78_04935 [Roseicella frigidaeris]